MTLAASLLTALAVGVLQPVSPAEAPVGPEEERGDVEAVEVQSIRPRGSVTVDVEPEVTLSADDIKAIGGANVGELLERLSSLTASSRGRGDGSPIVLLNGRRTSGFQEVRGIPREAIERWEILPEDVSLAYGYPADQKVVNIVLKPAFRQTSVRADAKGAAQGGAERGELAISHFGIRKGDRWNLQLEYARENPLFESDRDIVRDGGSRPYDLTGNVTGLPYGDEIDPALSVLAGQTVLVAAAPAGNATPTLADFANGAGAVRSGDLSAWRTLSPEQETGSIEGSLAHDLDGKTQATVSASIEARSSLSYLGLPGVSLVLPQSSPFSPFANDVQVFRYVDDPVSMTRTSDSLTAKAGVVLDGNLPWDAWRWTLSGDYSRAESDSVTGRGYSADNLQARLNAGAANPFAPFAPADLVRLPDDRASSVNTNWSVDLLLSGETVELPAGPLQTTFDLGYDSRSLDSESLRGGVRFDRALSRERLFGKGGLRAPLIARDEGPLGFLGTVSANLTLEYTDYSDFGGLSDLGAGLFWSPFEQISLNASYRREEGAPDIAQLNDPIISTPNVPVFDAVTGQTVLITRITGGNPNLTSDTRQTATLGVGLSPFKDRDLSVNLTYSWSRIDDAISSFPTISPGVEAALPGRFTRDASGQLIALDARALNYSRTEKQDLRMFLSYGFNFGKPTGPAAGMRGMGGPGGGRRPGGPGGGGRFGGGGPGGFAMRGGPGGRGGGGLRPGQGRVQFFVTYVYRLQDEIEVRPGLPVIDQLDGGASLGVFSPRRQELFSRVSVSKDGYGAVAQIRWRDGATIDGGPGGTDLTIAPYANVDLELSVDLGERKGLTEASPWLKGVQLQLNLQNLFDARQEVRSSNGQTPLTYQPDYLDPNGRYVGVRLRKTF